MKVLALVANCTECPNRYYYSGGQYTCTKADARLSEDCEYRLPEWCPLADYPAAAMSRLARENDELRKQIADIRGATPAPTQDREG